MSSDYRLSPSFGARLLGLVLVLLAVLVFLATTLVALLGLPAEVVLLLAVAGVAAVVVAGWLTTRAYVVRLDQAGYRVRLVRGAGVKQATWREVSEATTTTVDDVRVVVLRLVDGRTTTIPVQVLASDPDAFVRDLRAHLRRGEGLTPLG
jgi:hypothetical protein